MLYRQSILCLVEWIIISVITNGHTVLNTVTVNFQGGDSELEVIHNSGFGMVTIKCITYLL